MVYDGMLPDRFGSEVLGFWGSGFWVQRFRVRRLKKIRSNIELSTLNIE
jgi:hypothetical protein